MTTTTTICKPIKRLTVFATIPFGKYKGFTIKSILKTDPHYLVFLRKRGFKFDTYINQLLNTYRQ